MDVAVSGGKLQFSLSGDDRLIFALDSSNTDMTFSLSAPSYFEPDLYTGETVVNPDFVGKVLNTRQKLLTSDISVNPIQVEEVSNTSGGVTVYIGGII